MNLAVLVMAAGRGTRMQSATPKALQPLAGRLLVEWVIAAARGLVPQRLIVVASPATRAGFGEVEVVVQSEPLGTGDAVASARGALSNFDGDILVLPADAPLVTTETLSLLVERHVQHGAAVSVLSFEATEPLPYGRIIRSPDGRLRAIVEEADASAQQRAISEFNSSIYVFASSVLWRGVERLDRQNAKRELQLTSAIAHIVADGATGIVVLASDPTEARGVNTRADLDFAAAVLRQRGSACS